MEQKKLLKWSLVERGIYLVITLILLTLKLLGLADFHWLWIFGMFTAESILRQIYVIVAVLWVWKNGTIKGLFKN